MYRSGQVTGSIVLDCFVMHRFQSREIFSVHLWLPLTAGSNQDQSHSGGSDSQKPHTTHKHDDIMCLGWLMTFETQGFSKLWLIYLKKLSNNIFLKTNRQQYKSNTLTKCLNIDFFLKVVQPMKVASCLFLKVGSLSFYHFQWLISVFGN